ncbi:MAG: glycogen/starch synthase [bacterium]|nr:glycogen/starch synthase [bacterium]
MRIFLYYLLFFVFVSSLSFASKVEEETLKLNFNLERSKVKLPLVLHAALEGPEAIVGGLGSVVRDLSREMKGLDAEVITILPYYQFLKKTLPEKYQIKSLGFVKHELFGGKVSTEVFWNQKCSQLLFDFHPSIKNFLYAVKGRDKIYESTYSYGRILAFNSCISKFAHLVDASILHLHAWQTYLSSKLIQDKYNPVREKKVSTQLK